MLKTDNVKFMTYCCIALPKTTPISHHATVSPLYIPIVIHIPLHFATNYKCSLLTAAQWCLHRYHFTAYASAHQIN